MGLGGWGRGWSLDYELTLDFLAWSCDRSASCFRVFALDWRSACNWYEPTMPARTAVRQCSEISPSVISRASRLQENVLSSLAVAPTSALSVCRHWLCSRVQAIISTTKPLGTMVIGHTYMHLFAVAGNCSHAYPEPQKAILHKTAQYLPIFGSNYGSFGNHACAEFIISGCYSSVW